MQTTSFRLFSDCNSHLHQPPFLAGRLVFLFICIILCIEAVLDNLPLVCS
jgi:hypothetical protein